MKLAVRRVFCCSPNDPYLFYRRAQVDTHINYQGVDL
jgi:hypothetical protein